MDELLLPTTFEDLVSELGASHELDVKLAQFVVPVEKAEQKILAIASRLRNSGKAVFLHGAPGVGKSTFIQSLGWRTHLGFAAVHQIDASALPQRSLLDAVLEEVRSAGRKTKALQRDGVVAVVLNYLENLSGQPMGKVKAFFRALNGILRTQRLLLVWPVTDAEDASSMLEFASEVSGTVFERNREILEFKGPPKAAYADIAGNTISVLNRGREISDFGLTRDDLEEVLSNAKRDLKSAFSIRSYLEAVHSRWEDRSGYLEELQARIPNEASPQTDQPCRQEGGGWLRSSSGARHDPTPFMDRTGRLVAV